MITERKAELFRDLVVFIAKKLDKEGIGIEEYPVAMAEILRIFMTSWARANGIPELAAIDLIRDMADAIEKIIIDIDAN